MNRHGHLTFGLVAAVLLLACIPVALSVYLARERADREAFVRLDGLATSLGRQLAQTYTVMDELIEHAAASGDQCTPENIHYLHEFQVKSYGVKSILVMEPDGNVRCSSSGDLFAGVRYTNPEITLPDGTTSYVNVRVPHLDNRLYVLLEKHGFGLLLYPYGVISPFTQQEMAVGIFSPHNGQFSAKHGPLKDSWTAPLAEGKVSDFLIDDASRYFVVRHRPPNAFSNVVVAIPLATVEARAADLRKWFVPLGVLAGLALIAAVYLVNRHSVSPRTRVLRALQHNRFFLMYQPVVDLQDNDVWVGAEALIRWREADGSLLAPDTFISFAQEAGLIHLITQRVLDLIRSDLKTFLHQHPNFRIGLNLTPMDLQSTAVVQALKQTIHDVGEGNGRFLVEITEQGLLDEGTAREVMGEIRDMGVDIAIDDFGTGYSSLAYLNTYPFNLLKIDRTFVTAACTDAINSKIAGHIVELGRTVKMEVVAEGIETEQEASLFRRWGVDFGQGYLFARPMPAKELIERYPQHAPVPPPEI